MKLSRNYLVFKLLAILMGSPIFAQKPKEEPPFDIADFNAKFETAKWLVNYDAVAWKTSDIVMAADKTELAKLGREWFGFQDNKKIWHAVYGKLGNGKYDSVFHYVVDSKGKINRSPEKIDQQFLDFHAGAISTAAAQLQSKIPAGSPTFNQYIGKTQ
jgi:hypothetical protein